MSTNADRSYLRWFFLLALLGLVVDQASKYGVFAWLYRLNDEHTFVVVPDTFNLVANYTHVPFDENQPFAFLRTVSSPMKPHVNHGALFGIGGDSGFGNVLFTVVSAGAALVIVVVALRPSVRHDRLLSLSLGLILSGTVGNFYDRVVFGGVRDFFHWYRFYNWPVFNVADICLVCGAGLLVLHAVAFAEDAPAEPAPTPPQGA